MGAIDPKILPGAQILPAKSGWGVPKVGLKISGETRTTAAGSQTVQQQALRDFAQAMKTFFDTGQPGRAARRGARPGGTSWRKAGRHEGFRIVGRGSQWDVRRVSRMSGQVWVPKGRMGAVPLVPCGARRRGGDGAAPAREPRTSAAAPNRRSS